MTAAQHLREKATQGAIQLYGEITPVVQDRLDHELEIIARMGLEPIFLIVEEVLNFARQKGVPFSSRGSAASSRFITKTSSFGIFVNQRPSG